MAISLHSITRHEAAIKRIRNRRGIFKRGANRFDDDGQAEAYSYSFASNHESNEVWKDYTNLMKASKLGDYSKVVKVLEIFHPEEAALAVNMIGGWNETNAIMLAAESGSFEIVQYLIEKGGSHNLNQQNKMGNTALIIAAEKGHLSIVKLLIEHGASAYTMNNNRQIALMLAIDGGHLDIVQYLTSIEKEESVPISDKSKEMTSNQLLIENRWNKSALIIAAEFGKDRIVEWLIEQK